MNATALQDGGAAQTGLIDDHLHARGEGFFALTYGVADMRQAVAQAQARGVPPCLDASGNPAAAGGRRQSLPRPDRTAAQGSAGPRQVTCPMEDKTGAEKE